MTGNTRPALPALAAALRPPAGVAFVPCTILTVTPLTVDLGDGVSVPAVKVAGATYTAGGRGNALLPKAGKPQILPIG